MGVPSSLLQEYMDQGDLGFREITGRGYRLHQMQVSIPEISSTCWTSFMTRVNPGEHGIYGFMDLRPRSYQLFFPSARDVQAPTMWDIVGEQQEGEPPLWPHRLEGRFPNSALRSIVLNIPQTYPARPINGIMTAGFVCPDLQEGHLSEAAYEWKSITTWPTSMRGRPSPISRPS
ncbi:MAG: alkaline phosphatase family protein [Nitrospiraceae bacterium]